MNHQVKSPNASHLDHCCHTRYGTNSVQTVSSASPAITKNRVHICASCARTATSLLVPDFRTIHIVKEQPLKPLIFDLSCFDYRFDWNQPITSLFLGDRIAVVGVQVYKDRAVVSLKDQSVLIQEHVHPALLSIT